MKRHFIYIIYQTKKEINLMNNTAKRFTIPVPFLIILASAIVAGIFVLINSSKDNDTVVVNSKLPSNLLVGPHVATGTIRGEQDTTLNVDFEVNSENKDDYSVQSVTVDKTRTEQYIVKDSTVYFTESGVWGKGTVVKGQSPTRYTISADDIASYEDQLQYQSKEQCSSKPCDYWKVADDYTTIGIYVSETGTIARYTASAKSGLQVDINYDFSAVPNVHEIPKI